MKSKYRKTLRNSGALFNHNQETTTDWRHRAEECSRFGWKTYEEADRFGEGVYSGGHTVTACQFCNKWHCKRGVPPKTGVRKPVSRNESVG